MSCRPSPSGLAAVAAGFDGLKFGPPAPNGKGQFRGIRLGRDLQVYEKLWLFRFSQITATANPIQGWANFGPSTGFGVQEFTGGNHADSGGFDADSEGPKAIRWAISAEQAHLCGHSPPNQFAFEPLDFMHILEAKRWRKTPRCCDNNSGPAEIHNLVPGESKKAPELRRTFIRYL